MDSSLVVDTINRIVSSLKVKQPGLREPRCRATRSSSRRSRCRPCLRRSWPSRSAGRPSSTFRSTSTTSASTTSCLEGGRRRDDMDVLLVAVKRDKINDYTSVITQAGKTPVLVDVDAFALQNAYEANYDVDPGEVVALVNIGACGDQHQRPARGAKTAFWRDISFGGNQFTDAIQSSSSSPSTRPRRSRGARNRAISRSRTSCPSCVPSRTTSRRSCRRRSTSSSRRRRRSGSTSSSFPEDPRGSSTSTRS